MRVHQLYPEPPQKWVPGSGSGSFSWLGVLKQGVSISRGEVQAETHEGRCHCPDLRLISHLCSSRCGLLTSRDRHVDSPGGHRCSQRCKLFHINPVGLHVCQLAPSIGPQGPATQSAVRRLEL